MWDLFQAGGPVMWPLLLCSLASLTVILERAVFWWRYDLARDAEGIEFLLEYCRQGKDVAIDPGKKIRKGAVFKMLQSGIAHWEFSSTRAMESVALDEVKKMRRGMSLLDTIITAAPMLGILGTVMGIINSFDMLSQVGIEEPQAVVAGIAEALITTAAGLIISVATVFPFNYFNSRVEHAQDVFEDYGNRLEILLDYSMRLSGENCKP